MEPNYLQIEKDNRIIQFRVDIDRKFAYSEYSMNYFDYYIRISDEYVDSFVSSDLLLAVDDYRNIRIYDKFMKEYVGFEVDDLNMIHYMYDTAIILLIDAFTICRWFICIFLCVNHMIIRRFQPLFLAFASLTLKPR
jgi:hypothetical protein